MLVFRVLAPQGVRGEVRVAPASDWRRLAGRTVHVGLRPGEGAPHAVLAARPHRAGAVVRLSGVETREAAERLRGQVGWVPRSTLPELPAGEWYVLELVGRTVVGPSGLSGVVTDVVAMKVHDLLAVRLQSGREVLVPFVRALVEVPPDGPIELRVGESFFDGDDAD